MDTEASAKEVDDLLTEMEDLSFQDEKREDKPKKEKKKKSGKSKNKGMLPPNMGPPPTMGPPVSAPGKSLGGGRHGDLEGNKAGGHNAQDFGLEEDGFLSPDKGPAEAKIVDVHPANGGSSPTQAKFSSDGSDFGSAGAFGGQSAMSRARVLQQQRELQMRRRQQAMLGNTSMMRSTDRSLEGPLDHTPAMRQFGPKDPVSNDPYGSSGVGGSGEVFKSNDSMGAGNHASAGVGYDSGPISPGGQPSVNGTSSAVPPNDAIGQENDKSAGVPRDAGGSYDGYPGHRASAGPGQGRRVPPGEFPVSNSYESVTEESYNAYGQQRPGSVYAPAQSPHRNNQPPPHGQGYGPAGRFDSYSNYGGGGGGYGRGYDGWQGRSYEHHDAYDHRGYGGGGYDPRVGPQGGGQGYEHGMGRGIVPGPGYDQYEQGGGPMGRGAPLSGPGGDFGYDQRGARTNGAPGYDPRMSSPVSGGPGYDGRGGPTMAGYDPRAGPIGEAGYDPPMGRGAPMGGGISGGPGYDPRSRPVVGPGYEAEDGSKWREETAKGRHERQPVVEQSPEKVPTAVNARAADEPSFDIRSLKLDDSSNLRNFLMRPAPREAKVVQCYIKRNKSTFRKMFPEYRVYIKIPGDGNGAPERDLFLMCGKKRSGQKTSNYLISMSEDDLRRDSHNYLGKLRANFVGTEFKIYDNGSNPDDVDNDDTDSNHARQELGVVQYESNVMGSRGPRRMQVGLPRVVDTEGAVFQPTVGSKDSMMAKFKKRDFTNMVVAYNKPPRWNDTVGAFVLNFNGRVTMASVKNFQLITHDDQDQIILQFGRIAKDEFTMDFQWPMTPFQAFAVTLSSFDSKIACD